MTFPVFPMPVLPKMFQLNGCALPKHGAPDISPRNMIDAKTNKRIVVEPTWPNSGVRIWYQKALETLIGEAHLDISLQLGLALLETPPTLIAADAKSPVSNIDKTLKAWSKKWTLKFNGLSLDLSRKFVAKNFRYAETSMKAAFKKAGFTVAFKPGRPAMEAYRKVIAENVNLIKSIPQQYLTDVQSSVWSSVSAGGNMGTLSRKLHKNYEVTVKRAALIARDQNAKATATIENARRQQLGIKKAIWQHSAGGKEPRPSHVAMNGKEFDLSKGMYDPDEKEWIFPGQLINCRCTSRSIIPGFED
jgi:SPP1 gp7 family putative phage head morphogenesis protein